MFADRETLLSPDVAFVRAERVPTGEEHRGFLRLAPDLAVEVLSPSDSRAAALRKGLRYIEAGVRLVWLVDPLRRIIVVLTPDDLPITLREGDALNGGDVLPGFAAPVAEVFR